jgi:dihydroxy-acid dehydratase
MYTANTMASAIEALGMSLPNSSAQNAISPRRWTIAAAPAPPSWKCCAKGIKPLDILTKKAFENAITVVIALGGSTNAVLHLLAIAHAAKVKLTLDDFTRIGKRVPVLADLKPSGKHLMSELVAIGGIRPLMKMLLDKKAAARRRLTVTGETMARNARRREARIRPARPSSSRSTSRSRKDSHLVILRGNLAPEGAVAKITGKEGLQFTGRARVFNSEEAALEKILDGTIKGRRHRHPLRRAARRAGHARNAFAHLRHHGQGTRQGRGAHHRRTVFRRQPRLRGRATSRRRLTGGPLALVKNGDPITIDAEKRELTLEITGKELNRPPQGVEETRAPRYTRGVLAKYAAHVTSASKAR